MAWEIAFRSDEPEWYENHDRCCRKLYWHLRKKLKCIELKENESLLGTRRPDVYGYNAATNTHYICEVKVGWSDLKGFRTQLSSPVRRLRQKYRNANVVPVLAIPIVFQRRLQTEYPEDWKDVKTDCRSDGISIWAIEWKKGIRQIQSSKATTLKPRAAKPKAVATKTTATKGSAAKTKAIKTKTTKPKSTRATKPKTSKTKDTATKTKATKSRTGKAKTTRAKR